MVVHVEILSPVFTNCSQRYNQTLSFLPVLCALCCDLLLFLKVLKWPKLHDMVDSSLYADMIDLPLVPRWSSLPPPGTAASFNPLEKPVYSFVHQSRLDRSLNRRHPHEILPTELIFHGERVRELARQPQNLYFHGRRCIGELWA